MNRRAVSAPGQLLVAVARYLQLVIFASLSHHRVVVITMLQPCIDAQCLQLVISASLLQPARCRHCHVAALHRRAVSATCNLRIAVAPSLCRHRHVAALHRRDICNWSSTHRCRTIVSSPSPCCSHVSTRYLHRVIFASLSRGIYNWSSPHRCRTIVLLSSPCCSQSSTRGICKWSSPHRCRTIASSSPPCYTIDARCLQLVISASLSHYRVVVPPCYTIDARYLQLVISASLSHYGVVITTMLHPGIDMRYLQLAIFASLLHHHVVAIAMFQP